MSMDPLDIILKQLDRIERSQERTEKKLDEKVDYRTFNEFKRVIELQQRHLDDQMDEISKAAVTPDQITNLISTKLQDSQARGITARDRWIRWIVAGATLLTSALLIFDRLTQ